MQLTEEQHEIIRNCGGLEYSPQRIAKVLMLDAVDTAMFLEAFEAKHSIVRELYEEGKAKALYEVENAALKDLRSGEPDAIEFLNKQQHFNRVEKMKLELFGIPQK